MHSKKFLKQDSNREPTYGNWITKKIRSWTYSQVKRLWGKCEQVSWLFSDILWPTLENKVSQSNLPYLILVLVIYSVEWWLYFPNHGVLQWRRLIKVYSQQTSSEWRNCKKILTTVRCAIIHLWSQNHYNSGYRSLFVDIIPLYSRKCQTSHSLYFHFSVSVHQYCVCLK